MHLEFHGAARTVTGSRHLLSIKGHRVLLDCGLYQGRREEADRLTALRNRMRQRIQSKLDYVHLNGSWEHRLPGNLNLSFEFVEGESILMALNKEVAVSSGSACTSASLEPSYVLRAVGIGSVGGLRGGAGGRRGQGRYRENIEHRQRDGMLRPFALRPPASARPAAGCGSSCRRRKRARSRARTGSLRKAGARCTAPGRCRARWW